MSNTTRKLVKANMRHEDTKCYYIIHKSKILNENSQSLLKLKAGAFFLGILNTFLKSSINKFHQEKLYFQKIMIWKVNQIKYKTFTSIKHNRVNNPIISYVERFLIFSIWNQTFKTSPTIPKNPSLYKKIIKLSTRH